MILLIIIFLQSHTQAHHAIDDEIRHQMKICSYDLKCEGFDIDFIPHNESIKLRELYKKDDLYTFFEVPTVDGYLLKVILSKQKYEKKIQQLKTELLKKFLIYASLIALLSFVFSLYALRPLKKALNLNEEFVKDIIHDINTPLSSMVINFKLFKKEIGENRKIERMQNNVNKILSLQNNLKSFLDNSKLQKEELSLDKILEEKIDYFKGMYPEIKFKKKLNSSTILTNKDAFSRILDNLIANACKYSPNNGLLEIIQDRDTLAIIDHGDGIKDVKKVFKRYYKENQRGVGIGMHIVKKLCDELAIGIEVKSKLKVGTTVLLKLNKVIIR
jgi:signal transduction histidine kinase